MSTENLGKSVCVERSRDTLRSACVTSLDYGTAAACPERLLAGSRRARDERTSEIKKSTESGFTLIEALVALLILGVAAAGLVRAVESHIDSIARLEERATAVWVAENRLTELALGEPSLPATVDMLGRRWQVRTMIRTSPDPDLSRIDVAVGPPAANPLVTLGGFVDRGPKIAPVPAA